MKKEHKYTEYGFIKFLKDGAECFWHFWIRHRVLIVDVTGKMVYFGEKARLRQREVYDRKEYWVDTPVEKIHEDGYRRCEGLHDNLAWFGVPVFMKFNEIRIKEEQGLDSPRFLYDRSQNNLTTKFARSLARAQALTGMDWQKLLLMGGIGIAAVIGMKVLGVF